MQWALALSGFIFGVLLGYVGKTYLLKNKQSQKSDEALNQTKMEFSQYKQEVSDTLDEQYRQLNSITEQINEMKLKWNESCELLLPENDKRLTTTAKNDRTVDTPS